jgi:hypothetical protein
MSGMDPHMISGTWDLVIMQKLVVNDYALGVINSVLLFD